MLCINAKDITEFTMLLVIQEVFAVVGTIGAGKVLLFKLKRLCGAEAEDPYASRLVVDHMLRRCVSDGSSEIVAAVTTLALLLQEWLVLTFDPSVRPIMTSNMTLSFPAAVAVLLVTLLIRCVALPLEFHLIKCQRRFPILPEKTVDQQLEAQEEPLQEARKKQPNIARRQSILPASIHDKLTIENVASALVQNRWDHALLMTVMAAGVTCNYAVVQLHRLNGGEW